MALSKEFFLCGWNIFDLIIVTASLLDIIFELVDGLSVLRGLRLVRSYRHAVVCMYPTYTPMYVKSNRASRQCPYRHSLVYSRC